MGLGVGLILAAVGAVLAFAVNTTVSGVDIHTIGWILLIVGIVGILLSLIFWSSWAGPGYFNRRRTFTTRARQDPLVAPATRRAKSTIHSDTAGSCYRPFPFVGAQAIGSSRKKELPVRPSESTQMRPFMRVTSSREM